MQRITLGDALQRMEQSSLDLRLAREAVAAARARAVTAGTRPNPTLGIDREQLGGAGGYHETVLTVGQSLDVTGQRQARRDVAGREVAAAEARLAAETARVRAEVRTSYLRAVGAEARLAVLSDAVLAFREAERAGQSRYREGDISMYELQRLQVETARYETMMAEARLEQLRAGRDLASLTVFEPGREGLVLLAADSLTGLLAPAAVLSGDAALAFARRAPTAMAARRHDRRDKAVEYFMVDVVRLPAEFVAFAKTQPWWAGQEAIAHTLAYDAEVMGDYLIPTDRARKVGVPTIILTGGDSFPFFRETAEAVAGIIPDARTGVLEAQEHNVDPQVIGAALAEFFAS